MTSKRAKMKMMMKPIIKELIAELLFEEGVLFSIIREVAIASGPVLTESRSAPQRRAKELPEGAQARESREASEAMIRKIRNEGSREVTSSRARDQFEKSGMGSFFEGTAPLKTKGVVNEGRSGGGGLTAPSPLAGIDPDDEGVNIDALDKLLGNKWGEIAKRLED